MSVGGDGRAEVNGEVLTLLQGPAGSWRIVRGTHQAVAHVVRHADRVWVHAAGEVYVFDVTSGRAAPPRTRSAPADELAAPMPATVREVFVAPGDEVKRGDTLVMLEAMKMELPVRAAGPGTVRAVRCQVGELVQPGVPLVEIE